MVLLQKIFIIIYEYMLQGTFVFVIIVIVFYAMYIFTRGNIFQKHTTNNSLAIILNYYLVKKTWRKVIRLNNF